MNIRNRNKKLVLKKFYMNILVISSHPDDEVLGMGGTIYKLANEGHKIYLCVVTDGKWVLVRAIFNEKNIINQNKSYVQL